MYAIDETLKEMSTMIREISTMLMRHWHFMKKAIISVCNAMSSICNIQSDDSTQLINVPERHQSLLQTSVVQVTVFVFTARCTLVQSAVLRSHVVCLSVCLSVCNVGEL